MFRALPCPSSGARQIAVAASGFLMNVEVEVFSAMVARQTAVAASGFRMNVEVFSAMVARQTAIAASGFHMNVEVEVFSAMVARQTISWALCDNSGNTFGQHKAPCHTSHICI